MQKIEEENKKLEESAHKYEEKYEKFQISPISSEKMNFPTFYLTRDEIVEYNEEFKKSGIDLKVVPMSEYLSLNKSQGNSTDPDTVIEKFGNSIFNFDEEKEEDQKYKEDDLPGNDKPNIKEFRYANKEYLGKKKKRESNESKEYIKSSENKKISSFNIEINKNQIKWDDIKKEMKKRNLCQKIKMPKKKKKEKKQNDINAKKKEINLDFSNIFRKLKETCEYNKNEEKRCKEVIQEIEEQCKNLTENGLIQMANDKKIRRIGNEFSIDELRKKNLNFLENLLCDIKQNSEVFDKLDQKRNPTIRAKEIKEELINKSKEKEYNSTESK